MLNVLVFILSESTFHATDLARELREITDIDRVQTALCFEDAQRILAAREADVLVIDLGWRITEGLNTLSKLRMIIDSRNVRVIAIADAFDDEKISRAVQTGVSYCMSKPVSASVLYERILMIRSVDTTAGCASIAVSGDFFRSANSLLNDYGLIPDCLGYGYIRDAVRMCFAHHGMGNLSLTKDIYPYIAKLRSTSRMCVERAIRSCISSAYEYRHIRCSEMSKYSRKPRNKQLIAQLTQALLEQYNMTDADENE